MRRRLAILVNPVAGGGRAVRGSAHLAEALQRAGFVVASITASDPARALDMARAAVADDVDCVVAAGGDGTLSIALQAVAGTSTPLGIAALGTANDNARGLGLPIRDARRAADVIAAWNPRAIDVGAATTSDGVHRWFLGVLSSGFDAMVNERSTGIRWPRGNARYLVALVAELRSFKPLRFEIDVDGTVLAGDAMFAAIGNGVRYGGGMRVCEGALVDDGLLTMTWIHPIGTVRFITTFPDVFRGTHIRNDAVSQHTSRHFQVRADGQVAYADGERIGPLPVEVGVHPGGVRVLLPQGSVIGAVPRGGPGSRR